jgi:hypothetical protein
MQFYISSYTFIFAIKSFCFLKQCEGKTHKRISKKGTDNVLKYSKNQVQKLKFPKNGIDWQKNEKLEGKMIFY